MNKLFSNLRRAPALTTAFFIATTIGLSGCASRNPLIDEPAATAKPDAAVVLDRAEPVKTVVETKPAQETQSAAPAIAASGAQASPPAGGNPNQSAPTGVKRWLGIFTPYKINIQQGNFISQDMAAKLRPGMTKEQVRFVLGTPLLTDLFHADRWDYLFRLQKPNGELTTNRVAVFFKDDRVERIVAGVLPSESEYLSNIAGPAPASPEKSASPAVPAPLKPSTQP
jgi:outer membrane protein assembly factor BamE